MMTEFLVELSLYPRGVQLKARGPIPGFQKVNAFKQLVQTRSNAEKTADFIGDDRDNGRPLTYRCHHNLA